ncbi:MAG: hypothetical protein FWD37_03295 [Methanomassiliicoccaceae archaeon]|nr:hypothetical protein [Methanomassiliicoccaceae archaeon]
MGNASTSRASKGKGVFGGLFRRVTGHAPDAERTAPRTGIDIKDRFSALASPTDGMTQRTLDEISFPDQENDVKVIHTSAARTSGSVRFSDMVSDHSSAAEDNFNGRITFDDEDEDDTPSGTPHRTFDEITTDANSDGGYYIPDVVVVTENKETQIVYPETILHDVPVSEVCEEIQAEETAIEKEAVAEVASVCEIPDDDYDGGYDFLPRRNTVPRMRSDVCEPEEPVCEVATPVVEEKKSTLLAERLRARQTTRVQETKPRETEVDGPMQHEGITRTSLLDKLSREEISGASISEILHTNVHIEESEKEVFVNSVIEECDAITDNITDVENIVAEDIVADNVFAEEIIAEEDIVIDDVLAEEIVAEEIVADDILAITTEEEILMDDDIDTGTEEILMDVENIVAEEDIVIDDVLAEEIIAISIPDVMDDIVCEVPEGSTYAETEDIVTECPAEAEIIHEEMIFDEKDIRDDEDSASVPFDQFSEIEIYDPMDDIGNNSPEADITTEDHGVVDIKEQMGYDQFADIEIYDPMNDTEIYDPMNDADDDTFRADEDMRIDNAESALRDAIDDVASAEMCTEVCETIHAPDVEMPEASAEADTMPLLLSMAEAEAPAIQETHAEEDMMAEDITAEDAALNIHMAFISEESVSPSSEVTFVWGQY